MTKEKATTLANQKGYPYIAVELEPEAVEFGEPYRVIPEHYLLYGDPGSFIVRVYYPRFGFGWQPFDWATGETR